MMSRSHNLRKHRGWNDDDAIIIASRPRGEHGRDDRAALIYAYRADATMASGKADVALDAGLCGKDVPSTEYAYGSAA